MIFANYDPQSYTKMCRNFFVKPGNFFFSEIWKMTEFHFWAMLKQPHVRASRASPAQSHRVWGWFIPKTFQGEHFLFSGELIWSICFWVICPWNKFEEKAQCEAVLYYTNLHDKDFFTSKMPLGYLIKLTPVWILSSWTAVHLNKYKTVPCFCQLSQNLTTDCVLISVFYLFLPGSIKKQF